MQEALILSADGAALGRAGLLGFLGCDRERIADPLSVLGRAELPQLFAITFALAPVRLPLSILLFGPGG